MTREHEDRLLFDRIAQKYARKDIALSSALARKDQLLTAMRQAARLGRHALLYLRRHHTPGPVAEPLVVDGFESYAFSQYHPLHLNVAVGAESHYAYAFTHARLRRKGGLGTGLIERAST